MGKKILAALAVMATVLASCEYQRLDEETAMQRTPFTVEFDHSLVESIPSEYRVAFYPDDEQTRENVTAGYMVYDMTTASHELTMPAGIYRITAWNHDTEHTQTYGYGVRNDSYATTSRSAYELPHIIDSIYAHQTVLDYPDYMTHANVERFVLIPHVPDQVLTLQPDSMVIAVNMTIGGVHGLSEVIETRGSIDNVPARRYLAYDNITADTTVVIFECNVTPETNTVTAHFHLFGLEPTDLTGLNHSIILYFWMNGGRVYLPIDITELVARARQDSKRFDISIKDLNIDLREYIAPGNGYDVTVDDWDNIIIDMNL